MEVWAISLLSISGMTTMPMLTCLGNRQPKSRRKSQGRWLKALVKWPPPLRIALSFLEARLSLPKAGKNNPKQTNQFRSFVQFLGCRDSVICNRYSNKA
jgi:hypothetical protein